MSNIDPISLQPSELLQQLIRFDTTNPPGNEAACVQYINKLLQGAGIETTILALDESRPNLVARIQGRGRSSPLLLQGHVDVVTTANQRWQHPPFQGDLVDGYIWGRGALDMKGGIAMMVAAFMRMATEGITPPGDIILAILSDEENAGTFGAKYLVESHPELFAGVRYALGEFGGFSMEMVGKRFYPIMVAEKQYCHLRVTFSGPGGHGSMPLRDGTMGKLGHVLSHLNSQRLPVHVTPSARMMFEAIAAAISFPASLAIRGLLQPPLTDRLLDLLGEQLRTMDPLLHHTVSPTIVNGGEKINVIPSEITLELDARLLPGYVPDDVIGELRPIIGPEAAIEVVAFDPGPAEPNMGLFDTLGAILRDADPDGTPIPLVLPGVTDARFFSRLGIQTYGFLPMTLPPGFNFSQTIHAADERIPAAAVDFGTEAILAALQRF